jgi:hypothetical protein
MCQLDWVMGYPDIWFNDIPGVSIRVFLGEINVWIDRLSKTDCPPNVSRPHFNHGEEQKGGVREG